MAEDNKNSFRDMILIIFVVLICFGITIYGIAYLTGKVFSSSPEPEVAANERPKEVTTNPQEGDTLTFTSMGETADEVMPDGDNIRTTVTPPKQNNTEMAAVEQDSAAPIPAPVVEEKPVQTAEPVKQQEIKETAKQKEEVQKTTPAKKVEQTKPKQEAAPKPAPKKEEPKKETVKAAPPAQTGAYVVQLLAVQSREAAEKEAAKYRSKYPDVFIKQVVINGKTWYRVRLGVSATKEQAQQKADRVASEFKIKPIVTKNN